MRTALLCRVAGSLLLPPAAAAAARIEETNTADTKSKLMGFQCNTSKQIGVLDAVVDRIY